MCIRDRVRCIRACGATTRHIIFLSYCHRLGASIHAGISRCLYGRVYEVEEAKEGSRSGYGIDCHNRKLEQTGSRSRGLCQRTVEFPKGEQHTIPWRGRKRGGKEPVSYTHLT